MLTKVKLIIGSVLCVFNRITLLSVNFSFVLRYDASLSVLLLDYISLRKYILTLQKNIGFRKPINKNLKEEQSQ